MPDSSDTPLAATAGDNVPVANAPMGNLPMGNAAPHNAAPNSAAPDSTAADNATGGNAVSDNAAGGNPAGGNAAEDNTAGEEPKRPSRATLIRDLAVNVAAPYATYLLLSHEGVSLVWSLAAGSIFPLSATLVGFVRSRRVDALGIIVLVVTAASILGALAFTSPYLLLAKGSLITGGIGTLFLLSLLLSRPLIYHLASNTGQDPEARAEFAATWENEPAFRRLMRRLTLVWGLGMYAEASLRLLLIGHLPVAVFLPVSEAMWIAFFALMSLWSWRYAMKQMPEEA